MPQLVQEVDSIPVTLRGGPAPDPNWTYTDKAGHEHSHHQLNSIVGTPEDRYPTLRWVEDEPEWCEECREPHDRGHWECKDCGETIEPGLVMKGPRTVMKPGRMRYLIDDREVTEEEWNAEVAKQEAAKAAAEPETRYVTLTAHCPWGHLLELNAEMREDGPDGEVVTLIVDADEVKCRKCDSRLGDSKGD